MYRYFTANNTYKYFDVLQDFINEYNNHKHSTIKTTPTEASMKYNEKVIQNYVYSIYDKTIYKSKFMVKDRVRISKKGGIWVLLIVRGSTTTLPFSAFSDYVTFSSRVEMPALVVGL